MVRGYMGGLKKSVARGVERSVVELDRCVFLFLFFFFYNDVSSFFSVWEWTAERRIYGNRILDSEEYIFFLIRWKIDKIVGGMYFGGRGEIIGKSMVKSFLLERFLSVKRSIRIWFFHYLLKNCRRKYYSSSVESFDERIYKNRIFCLINRLKNWKKIERKKEIFSLELKV